jgi:hypothetical protein
MDLTISALTSFAPTAGNQRGRDHDVLLLEMLGGKRGLLGLVLFDISWRSAAVCAF